MSDLCTCGCPSNLLRIARGSGASRLVCNDCGKETAEARSTAAMVRGLSPAIYPDGILRGRECDNGTTTDDPAL